MYVHITTTECSYILYSILINDNLDLDSSRRDASARRKQWNKFYSSCWTQSCSSKKFRKSLAPMTHFYDFCRCAHTQGFDLYEHNLIYIYRYISFLRCFFKRRNIQEQHPSYHLETCRQLDEDWQLSEDLKKKIKTDKNVWVISLFFII